MKQDLDQGLVGFRDVRINDANQASVERQLSLETLPEGIEKSGVKYLDQYNSVIIPFNGEVNPFLNSDIASNFLEFVKNSYELDYQVSSIDGGKLFTSKTEDRTFPHFHLYSTRTNKIIISTEMSKPENFEEILDGYASYISE